jgi:TM2 domain-containing membrane protein YozV
MDCVNHLGTSATAYCQSCGKALCAACVRNAPGGQVLCEPCSTAWQRFQQPFAAPVSSGPNPSAAAVLGLIPGVGAMYNGQFFKGLIHVVIFAVLVSITSSIHGIFGIFVGAWILYQSFEAYHTAKALRDGQTPPDPLGLNEVGNWLNLGGQPRTPGQVAPGPAQQAPPGGYQPPYTAGPYQPPYQAPYPPPPGYADPAMPPVPPLPPLPPEYCRPLFWGRKEPVGAIVLIGLGLLFLLGQLDIFHGRLLEFTWPLLLIGLGVWLIVRRLGDSHGGSK